MENPYESMYEEYEELYKKYNILRETLYEFGRFLRANPPADLDWFFDNKVPVELLLGRDDPDGMKYINYFMEKAMKRIESENKEDK